MSINYPVESNTPLQPPPAWASPVGTGPTVVTATQQLSNAGGMKQYTPSGPIIAPGTTATASANVFTDVSFEPSLEVVIDITAVTGGDTLTVVLQGKSASGDLYPILTSAALSATGVVVLRVGPGFVPAANLTVNDMVPSEMVVTCTVAGSGTIAYGVDLVMG